MQELKNPEAAESAHVLIKTILFYGGIMFLIGFAFGVARELVFIPLAGKRAGHWVEFPMMLAATAWMAQITSSRLREATTGTLLALGMFGTAVMLLIESGFALYVLRLPPKDYLAGFDVTKGELFPWGLAFMALAPLAMNRFWIKTQ
ncbi:MAG: hypothetical protein AB7F96_10965 [Beijerinckiaceae bacterium]